MELHYGNFKVVNLVLDLHHIDSHNLMNHYDQFKKKK